MAEMRVVVKGKNLEVTPALRSYAEKKCAKFKKFLSAEQNVLVEVMMQIERGQHIAEITVDLTGLIIRGVGKTNDMYASIDEALERIERQFTKFKTKIQKKIQSPRLGELAGGEVESEVAQQLQDNNEIRIVRTKRFAFKPMSVEEAVMQMELLGHDFFVFSNASTDEVNVVYKRKNGDYGLIEPEF